MPILRAILVAMLLVVPGACASRSGGSTNEPRTRADLLTQAEMRESQWSNVYDMVRTLRPRWLQSRGSDTVMGEPTEVQVVIDGVKHGGVNTLRTYPLAGIVYIEFFDGITASSRWGLGFGRGAIFVSTRAR
jgi:hypothetical protein